MKAFSSSKTHFQNSIFPAHRRHTLWLKLLVVLGLNACVGANAFDQTKVVAWSSTLGKEESYSSEPSLWHYRKGKYELYFLAAHHETDRRSKTMQWVDRLFAEHPFDVLIIEGFPYSRGESPTSFLKQAQTRIHGNLVQTGESGWAALKAHERKIPFFGGEPGDLEVFKALEAQGYSASDMLGFYLARQIPQWVRQGYPKETMLSQMGERFLQDYCETIHIKCTPCPSLEMIDAWFMEKTGKNLSVDISTDETAPVSDSSQYLHRISTEIGRTRDRHLLTVIERSLNRYHRVAVVYGSSHYMTLKDSLENTLGRPLVIVDTHR